MLLSLLDPRVELDVGEIDKWMNSTVNHGAIIHNLKVILTYGLFPREEAYPCISRNQQIKI